MHGISGGYLSIRSKHPSKHPTNLTLELPSNLDSISMMTQGQQFDEDDKILEDGAIGLWVVVKCVCFDILAKDPS